MRQVPSGPPPVFVNWKQQMLLATDQVGIRDVTLPPNDVWRMVRDQFLDDDNVIVKGANKTQVLGRLYRTSTKHFGHDIFGRLEMEPLCDVKISAGLKFFQFHYAYYEDEVLHRIIKWAHPQLMDRIKQRQCSIFIDATYRCVPIRFYQLVILMLYDPISDLYLPIWYVLTTGKTSQVYEHLLHSIFVSSKKKLDPAHVV
ncbi:hypothetical protein L917_01075 [Phytophthora nicotianae]|uniref:MULE transposase domain-containing protein n=1 Tax=Phytophthora nicotianae TaxID=4792 RepID=W2M0W1_PHYNI|nr:hypothetical protein L917_01075 [Phytophthora nicotianae]